MILFAVRTPGWFWSRPWPSVPVLGAVAAAFVVTVALVNVPEARSLLRFGTVSLSEQVGIEAYAVAYLVVADVLQRAFALTQQIPHRHLSPRTKRMDGSKTSRRPKR